MTEHVFQHAVRDNNERQAFTRWSAILDPLYGPSEGAAAYHDWTRRQCTGCPELHGDFRPASIGGNHDVSNTSSACCDREKRQTDQEQKPVRLAVGCVHIDAFICMFFAKIECAGG